MAEVNFPSVKGKQMILRVSTLGDYPGYQGQYIFDLVSVDGTIPSVHINVTRANLIRIRTLITEELDKV